MLRYYSYLWMVPALAAAPAAAPPPGTIDELKAAIQNLLTRQQIPGAGIAIVTPDRIVWAGGIGKADIASARDVAAETLFRVGSISKSFVALALVKLQEEGRIDLEAPLKLVAPEIAIPNPWDTSHPVRVVHVLEHTAGFDDARFAEDYLPAGTRDMPLRTVLERFPGPQRVRWQPGTRMAYTNAGYGLAGYLIEKVTGRPFDEYIRENIFQPLGMERSGFGVTDATRALLAQGYNFRPPKPVPYRSCLIRSAGDMVSSPAELARFVQMLLSNGKYGDMQLVRPESLARMERGQTSIAARAGVKCEYGLANFRMGGAITRQGHGGIIAGFRSIYAYMPKARLGYVVMLNSYAPGNSLSEANRLLYEYLTAGMEKPPAPPVPPGDLRLERYAGVYLPADYRYRVAAFSEVIPRARRVTVSGGALYMSGLLGEGRQQLFPVSSTTFRTRAEVEASVAFVTSPERRLAIGGPRGYFERVPAWQPYTYAVGLLIALLLMLSSLAYALVWIPARLRGRLTGHVAVRAIPLAAVLSLVAAGLLTAAFVDDMSVLGRVNLRTLGYWFLSWAFSALSIAGLVIALRASAGHVRLSVRAHSLAVSLACCAVVAAMADWGLLGLRLWAF